MKNGYNNYRHTQAETADKGELLLMLFDGAIRFTKKAIESIEQGDIARKCESISRAFAIVAELHGTLDFEVSEEISGNLASLYVFVLERYTNANITHDALPLRDVLMVLQTLQEGWAEAVRSNQVVEGARGLVKSDSSVRTGLSVIAG